MNEACSKRRSMGEGARFQKTLASSPRVVINVSGEIFETFDGTLQRFPATLLGDVHKREAFYCSVREQYFFNRNRLAFDAILFFYQSEGKLTRPPLVELQLFEEECLFFGIPGYSIDEMKSREGAILEKEGRENTEEEASACAKWLSKQIWNFLEKPETSKAAEVFAIFSLLIITASVILDCLETVPSIRSTPDGNNLFQDRWFLVELSINSWFLFELLVRFAFSPNKCTFMKSTLNCMDVLAVVPFFIVLAAGKGVSSLSFLRILRFIRVIRLFRLSKHSKRLVVIGHILKHSIQDFQQLLLCLLLLVVFGGTLLFFAEGEVEGTQFTSIPEAVWWAVQTVMVLGYGDIVPITLLGKVLATGLMIFGALTISLPVLSLVMRFTQMYDQNTKIL